MCQSLALLPLEAVSLNVDDLHNQLLGTAATAAATAIAATAPTAATAATAAATVIAATAATATAATGGCVTQPLTVNDLHKQAQLLGTAAIAGRVFTPFSSIMGKGKKEWLPLELTVDDLHRQTQLLVGLQLWLNGTDLLNKVVH